MDGNQVSLGCTSDVVHRECGCIRSIICVLGTRLDRPQVPRAGTVALSTPLWRGKELCTTKCAPFLVIKKILTEHVHQLEYMFRKPKFLATSIYAAIFVFLGNTSGNGVVFGTKILQIMDYPDTVNIYDHRTGWRIKGLAVAAVTAACLLHGVWRAGGIWVQNTLAVVKMCILWFFIVAGLAAYSGKINSVQDPGRELSSSSSFKDIDVFTPNYGIHGWIATLSDVMFSYSGLESANCK